MGLVAGFGAGVIDPLWDGNAPFGAPDGYRSQSATGSGSGCLACTVGTSICAEVGFPSHCLLFTQGREDANFEL